MKRSFFFYTFFFHVEGESAISKGYSSSLPASISKDKINLENREKWEKFPVGPISPRPGPILLIQDTTAVKDVVNPRPSMDIHSTDPKRSSIYMAK